MIFDNLKNYSKKFVSVFYNSDKGTTQNVMGILFYSNKGFIVFDGMNYVGWSGQRYNNFLDLYKNCDSIPYSECTVISYRTPNGWDVSEYMKVNNNIEYNKILNALMVDLVPESPFNTIPDKFNPLDTTGMVYNPYSDRWSFL